MSDDQTTPESTEPLLEDQVEMELRNRLTVLEDHQAQAQSALGLLCLAVIVLAITGTALTLAVRKGLR